MERKVAPIAFSLLLSACAIAGCSPASAPPTPAAAGSTTTSAAELSATYGACLPGMMYDQGPPSLDWLARLVSWRRVTEVVRVGPDESWSRRVELRDDAGAPLSVSLSSGALPGVRWGVKNGAEVWLGFSPPGPGRSDDEVDGVAVFTAGDVFFPGECMDDQYSYAHSRLGAETAAVLVQLRSEPDLDARMELLRVDEEIRPISRP